MEKSRCVICGSTSFRIEEAQLVCNECNYVNEIQQEQFEDDYEDRQIEDNLNKEYLEKDFYEVLKKLYKNDKIIAKIKNYVFKDNDEFFVKYQKLLLNFMYVFISEHHLPPLLYDEVKKIWFYLLKVNIMNANVYVPMGDAKDSVKSVFEVIRAQKLKDISADILYNGNIIKGIKNVIKKMGLSKSSHFFIIQKRIISETGKSLEFLPKKSEVLKRSDVKLLNLYKQTALLDSEKNNKENFLKINEIIHNIRKSKRADEGEEVDQDGDHNFAISNVGANREAANPGGYSVHAKREEEDILSDQQLMEAQPRLNSLGDNYEDFNMYEGGADGDEMFNLGDFPELDQFGQSDRINQEEPPDKAAIPHVTDAPKDVENFPQDENYAQGERVYHFCSSFIINQLLKHKKLLRPVDPNISTNYMNRSVNYTNVIDLFYQHDFLYYFHEELRKKCDIEFLSFYDIMQVFKGEYDYLLPPSLGLSKGPYIPPSEGETTDSSPPKEDILPEEEHPFDELTQVKDDPGDIFGLDINEVPSYEELKMEQSSIAVPLTGDLLEKAPLPSGDEHSSIVESLRDNLSVGGEFSEFLGPKDAQRSGDKAEAGDLLTLDQLEGLYEDGFGEDGEQNALVEMLKSGQLDREIAAHKKHKRSAEEVEKILKNYQKYVELRKKSGKGLLQNERAVRIETLSDDERFEGKKGHKKGGTQGGKDPVSKPEERGEDIDLLGQLSPRMNQIIDAVPEYDVEGVPSPGANKVSSPLLQGEATVGVPPMAEAGGREKPIKKNSNNLGSGPGNASTTTSIRTVYKKLEHVNKIKRERSITIEKHSYDNGLKKAQKNYSKIELFVKGCILTQIKEENLKLENEKMLYIPDRYLIDSYIFDGLYENFLYISNLSKFRTMTIKHIYNEYVNFFLKDYREYLIDDEAYKFSYNFSFDLLFYVLYYSMKRLQIQCLPHNLTNYINLDNFNLYRIFNNVPELLQKIYKDESSLNTFPLKNTNFSEIKKSFFIRNLKTGVPFLCMHNYEHTSKHFTPEEENQIKANQKKKKKLHPHKITYFKDFKHLNKMNNFFSYFNRAKWVKELPLFNSSLITDLYSQINDLVFKFQLPNFVQIYSMKLLHMTIFKYRFYKFLFNVYSNQYDDMHTELNNFYSFKHILKDFKMFYTRRSASVFSKKEINRYILYLMKKELYLKKKILQKKKIFHKNSGQLNYKVYNKLNYFYRQKFICTFFITLKYTLSVEKKRFYSIAAACVLTACKFYYPMFNCDFFSFQNMFIRDKFESFHEANHYHCHMQQGVHLYNGGGLQEGPHLKGKQRTKRDGQDAPVENPPMDSSQHIKIKAALKRANHKTDKSKEATSPESQPHGRKRKLPTPSGEVDSPKGGAEAKRAKRVESNGEEVPPLGDGNLMGECLRKDHRGNNHTDYAYDHYSEIFTDSSEEASFFLPTDGGENNHGKNELEHFLAQDYSTDSSDFCCDERMRGNAYGKFHREIIFEEAPTGKMPSQRGRKTKMKTTPPMPIRRIHFKASIQKSTCYFVPIPSIMKLFFNYRRFASRDTTFDSLLDVNHDGACSSPDETDEEEQYISHVASGGNPSPNTTHRGKKDSVKKTLINKKPENVNRKQKYPNHNKHPLPRIYVNTQQSVSSSGRNKNRHGEKPVIHSKKLRVHQNPYCCKELLDAPPTVSPLERKVDQLKGKLFQSLCLSNCPQHIDHFNFDVKKLLLYNSMRSFMKECGLPPGEGEARNLLSEEASEWFFLLKMVSSWGEKGTSENSNLGINPSGSFNSNVDGNPIGEGSHIGRRISTAVHSRPGANHPRKDKDEFVNFNDETVEQFIKANSLTCREKNLYRALKKQSNIIDVGNAKGITNDESQIIRQTHLIHSKRYEILFFRYVMYEYYTMLPLLPDFQFIVDTLNVYMTYTWNVYHTLFLYYQIKHTIEEFFKCFTQVTNMLDYFLLIMKRKEYIDAKQFNCFFRNKYRKKKKKISYNLKRLFFVLELFSALYGVKSKIPHQSKFSPGEFFYNNCTLIYHRKKQYAEGVNRKKEIRARLSKVFKGGYYEYLNNMLQNVFNLDMVKRTVKRKMRKARNAIHDMIRNTYMCDDYIHSYVFPPTRKTLFHITVRHIKFFSLNFEGTLNLVRGNYATCLDEYFEAMDRCGLSSLGDVVTVLSVGPANKGTNRGGSYPIICSPKRRRNAHGALSKYLTLTLNMQKKKMPVPYLFCDSSASSSRTKDGIYFLHHDKSDVINDCINFVMRKNYKVLNNKELSDILKYKVVVDVQGQVCKQLEQYQDNDAGPHFTRSTCYNIEHDIGFYHMVKHLKYFKKMRRIITQPGDIFLLYYLSYCTNLFKRNLFSRSELCTNNFLARRILYSFLPDIFRWNKKSNKNSAVMKNKIINYMQLFRFILRRRRNTFLGSEGGMFVSICDPSSRCPHFGEKKKLFKNCPSTSAAKSNGTSIRCDEQFQSTLPLRRDKKGEPSNCTKWLNLVDVSKSYENYTKRLRYPLSSTNELLFNKIIFFNLANETVLSDLWQEGRHPPRGGEIYHRSGEDASKRHNRKGKGNQMKETPAITTPMERIAYSLILDNFINHNKQLILIRNANRFYTNLEEKIERKLYKVRNGMKTTTNSTTNDSGSVSVCSSLPLALPPAEQNKRGRKKGTKITPSSVDTPKIVKYIVQTRYQKKCSVLTSIFQQMDSRINNLPYNILPKEDPIKTVVTFEKTNVRQEQNVIEAVDSISSIHSKLFTQLKGLFSTVPLDGFLISHLEKRFAQMFPREDLKEELSYFVHDIYAKLKMSASNGVDVAEEHLQRGKNHAIERNVSERDVSEGNPRGSEPSDAPTEEDEFLYLSTDVDSYKTDSMYPLQLKKNEAYRDLRKYFKKNQKQLNIAMGNKESCEFNRFRSFFKEAEHIRTDDIIIHECYRIFANVFRKMSSCLSHFHDRDVCGAPFYRRLFEWHSNLNMYDPFLLIHNRHHQYDKAIRGDSSRPIVPSEEGREAQGKIKGDTNGRFSTTVMKKGKRKRSYKLGGNFHAEPYICIYNDNTFFNTNDASLTAEVTKTDKYEESLLNYSLNRNSHFEFMPNVNSFTLRLKNDYIKKKNKTIYQQVKKKQIHKIRYVQNVVRTGKYTYFFFSCLAYPMSHIPRIMYLFSIRYFPSLFVKTANYFNYLKVDHHLWQFLSTCHASTVDEIFKNVNNKKNSENIFHFLRFRGFYVNPFSLLGSIYYAKDIQLLCSKFKLSLCNYFNTLHTVLSVQNMKRESRGVMQERDKLGWDDRSEAGGEHIICDKTQIDQKSSGSDPDMFGQIHSLLDVPRKESSEVTPPEEQDSKSEMTTSNGNARRKKKAKKNYNDSHNYMTEIHIPTTIKFSDDEKNNIEDGKINKFFEKINPKNSNTFSKRSREIRNISLLEDAIQRGDEMRDDLKDMFFTSEMKELLSRENIMEDDDDNESETFLQRAPNVNTSITHNVLALRPVERGAKKRKQREQRLCTESKLESRPPHTSKRLGNLPLDRSYSDQLVHTEKEDHSNLHYYLFGDNETNLPSVIEKEKKASQRKAWSGHSKANNGEAEKVSEIAEMVGKEDETFTQNIPPQNDTGTNNDCVSEKHFEMYDQWVEQVERDSQSDLHGGSHVVRSTTSHNISVGVSHSASWNESRNASLFSTSRNPSVNYVNLRSSNGGRKMHIHKVGKLRNKRSGSHFKRGNLSKKNIPPKGVERIYEKCLREHLDTEMAKPFSTPSETINLYNVILNSLHNEILLKNDSITYWKYIKKTPLEFNYIVYKEFSTHTSYYSEPYDKSVLNEFVDIFYTHKFRDNYLGSARAKTAGRGVGLLLHVGDTDRIDPGGDNPILDAHKEGSESKSQVDEFFCLNDELFAADGGDVLLPAERTASESADQGNLQGDLQSDQQSDLQSAPLNDPQDDLQSPPRKKIT
ncbi:Uncharacterized protein PCOAH_00054630 [Plasmodium coatneyi]|uniref:Uncharacterized protein n=1 Tax=Plasmodium coatneyi TaxID=208452 RepID=A0A1B1E7Y5_9APIC|nr:Uncharacterized protein PCOAH_00054630 [Plasmodium coatneyi]ANQ11154.1 Uncharacterized protein PCOAH_00054630 [Plasmodium coatneyi]